MSSFDTASPLGLPGLGLPRARSAVADLSALRPQAAGEKTVVARAPADGAASARLRSRIWDLHASLHCSVIGTCLTCGELRRLLVRLKVAGAEAADDHELHMLGVLLAGRPQAGAKHLQKTLDRCHQRALDRFAKAKDAASVAALWDAAMKRGDIPGAYWALLTHPATTDAMVRRPFGEVHMLSHLVGAANRADIERLRRLEQDNEALTAKLERQQRQLRDGFTARDETIRRLTDALARKASEQAPDTANAADADALTAALAEHERRLAQELERRERLDRRIDGFVREREELRRALERSERDAARLRTELAAAEAEVEALLRQGDDGEAALDLRGATVLYLGGRAHQTPQLKSLVERSGGRFLHHDGGIEHNAALIPGLVGRADVAVFPVDCVSHDAVGALKRTCRQLGKRYVPLRTASLAGLYSGLAVAQREAAAPPSSAAV